MYYYKPVFEEKSWRKNGLTVIFYGLCSSFQFNLRPIINSHLAANLWRWLYFCQFWRVKTKATVFFSLRYNNKNNNMSWLNVMPVILILFLELHKSLIQPRNRHDPSSTQPFECGSVKCLQLQYFAASKPQLSKCFEA